MSEIKRPKNAEINQLTMKLIVGVIAIAIASVTSFVSTLDYSLLSVSESYFAGDWSRILFAISAFLLSYNGQTRAHMILSRVAALAGIGVAMFPCKCSSREEIIPYVHYASAAITFAVLAYFCIEFYRHAKRKGHRQAAWRAQIYPECFWAMVVAIAALAVNAIWGQELGIEARFPRIVFYGEAMALSAFGVCWLVASRVLPGLTRPEERHRLLAEDPPGAADGVTSEVRPPVPGARG